MKARQSLWLGALILALGFALGACGGGGGNGDGNTDGGGGSGTCQGANCGKPCTSNSSCGVGYFCSADDVCDAECTQGGAECGSGKFCNSNGRCEEGTGELDGGVCPSIEVRVDAVIPTVQLLIDHSGSMNVEFGNSVRVDAVREALLDNGGVVDTLQAQVRFGATLYTSDDFNPPCPRLTAVAPTLNNLDAIDDAIRDDLDVDALGEDTPTGESLEAVAEAFPAPQANDRRIIVLATDGEPDTCTDPDPEGGQRQEAARRRSEEAAKRVFDEFGIEVYVLSVGQDAAESHLQRVANAGVGKAFDDPDEAELYIANNKDELIAAFNDIIGGARDCSFTINGTVTDAEGGTVTLDGAELEYGTDWEVINNGKTLRLLGDACESYLDGEASDIGAEFECDSIIPIE
jgi:hypothetical protein